MTRCDGCEWSRRGGGGLRTISEKHNLLRKKAEAHGIGARHSARNLMARESKQINGFGAKTCTFSVNCLMTEGGRGGRGKASMGEGSDGPGIMTKEATFSSDLCADTRAARRLKPDVYAASACTPWPPSLEKFPTRKMRRFASAAAANVASRVEKKEVRPVHTRSESSQRSLRMALGLSFCDTVWGYVRICIYVCLYLCVFVFV